MVIIAVNAGVTVVTASATNPDGTVVTGYSVITVTATGGAGGTIASITVIPNAQTVPAPNATAQFLAIGTTTTGATVDLTNLVAWKSSSAQIGTIGAATGLATGAGQGSATMTAVFTPGGGGNVITGSAQFTVAGGTDEQFTAVTIIPSAQTLSVGQTSNFVALGTLGTNGLKIDVTNSAQIKWSSSVGSGLGAISNCQPRIRTRDRQECRRRNHHGRIEQPGRHSGIREFIRHCVRRQLCRSHCFHSRLFPIRFQWAIWKILGISWPSGPSRLCLTSETLPMRPWDNLDFFLPGIVPDEYQ